MPTTSDLDLLNEALADEHLGIAAYDAALGSGLLDERTAEAARAFQSDHKKHADLFSEQIVARGGTPAPPRTPDEYAKSFPPFTTAEEILAFAIELEATVTRAYLASVAEYEDRSLAVLEANIGAVEAQHWAVLLAATGANPVPSPTIDVVPMHSMPSS